MTIIFRRQNNNLYLNTALKIHGDFGECVIWRKKWSLCILIYFKRKPDLLDMLFVCKHISDVM